MENYICIFDNKCSTNLLPYSRTDIGQATINTFNIILVDSKPNTYSSKDNVFDRNSYIILSMSTNHILRSKEMRELCGPSY